MLRGGHLQRQNRDSNTSAGFKSFTKSSMKSLAFSRRAQARLTIYAKVANLRFRRARKEDIPVLRRMIFQER